MSFSDKKQKQTKNQRSGRRWQYKCSYTSYTTISCLIQEIDHLGLGLPFLAGV